MKNHVLNGGNENPSNAPLSRQRIKVLRFLFFGRIFNIMEANDWKNYLRRQIE